VDERIEQLKAQMYSDPAVDEHVDKVVEDLKASVREAAAEGRRMLGWEALITGQFWTQAIEARMRVVSRIICALGSVPGSNEDLVDGIELLRQLSAGTFSQAHVFEEFYEDISEEVILEILQVIRFRVGLRPGRSRGVLLWDRFMSELREGVASVKGRNESGDKRMVDAGEREAAARLKEKKSADSGRNRAALPKHRLKLLRAASSRSRATYEDLIQAADLLLACQDSDLGSALSYGRAEARPEISNRKELDLKLGADFRCQLEHLVLGFKKLHEFDTGPEMEELGGIVRFDSEDQTLWVVNRGARTLLGRAIAAKIYQYLMGVIPAPYRTDSGKVGEGRKYNRRALELATALVNSVYLGTYALPRPITVDQVRETHKSRFLS